jgi:hypothetical protein
MHCCQDKLKKKWGCAMARSLCCGLSMADTLAVARLNDRALEMTRRGFSERLVGFWEVKFRLARYPQPQRRYTGSQRIVVTRPAALLETPEQYDIAADVPAR